MDSGKIRAFKNELRNYDYYYKQLTRLKNLNEYYFYKLSGIKSADPSREPIHSPKNIEAEYELREKISFNDKRIEYLNKEINYINDILNSFEEDIKIAITEVYIKGKNSYKVAKKMNIAQNTLLYRINILLERTLV